MSSVLWKVNLRLEKLMILPKVSELLRDGDGHPLHIFLTLEHMPEPLLSDAPFISLIMPRGAPIPPRWSPGHQQGNVGPHILPPVLFCQLLWYLPTFKIPPGQVSLAAGACYNWCHQRSEVVFLMIHKDVPGDYRRKQQPLLQENRCPDCQGS